MKTYTVQRGDTLFNIAEKFYGDGHKYKLLAAYNHIENPNALEIGQLLKIPPVEDLQTTRSVLSDWHNYHDGSIYWRITAKGIEIKGKGLIKNKKYTQRAASIWEKYQQPILAASQKHGVPIPAIIATISTESSGNPKAYRYEPDFYDRYIKNKNRWKDNPFYESPKRISASYGLMQIMYTTAYSVGFRGNPEDLHDPETNIDVGSAYIASPFQKKNHGWDPPKIACAYNAGSVRPTKKNEWGMFYHPGHLDRWIPAYNGTIEALESENVPEPTEPGEPEALQPEPVKPPLQPEEDQSKQVSTLRFLFLKKGETTWKPVIIDIFKHEDSGIVTPLSYTIASPALDPNTGYTYDIPDVETGIYDFVFTDATSSSIIYDIANHEVDNQLEIIDLRQNLRSGPGELAKNATVVFRFPKEQGRVWKPMIVDVFKHEDSGIGEPVSYTIKIPSHGPEGGYIYEIPDFPKGVYDFVFTDASSQSVIQDISNYVVDQTLEIIDLRRNRAIYDEQESVLNKGLGTVLKNFFRKILSSIWN